MSWFERGRAGLRLILLLAVASTTSACGFHLRGPDDARLPASLSPLRVTVSGKHIGGDTLSELLRTALESGAGATLTEDPHAAHLEVLGERTERRVLSLDAKGTANGYVLRYELTFRLTGADSAVLIERQSINVLRDYNFTAVDALAKEREERELNQLMQRDAVRQLVRRLAGVTQVKSGGVN